MIVEEYEPTRVNGEDQLVKKQRCVRTIHAEQNLLLFTDLHDRDGATVYVTDQPCWTCANMLANSGVKEIVYDRVYPKDSDKVEKLMEQLGIRFRRLMHYSPPPGTTVEHSSS